MCRVSQQARGWQARWRDLHRDAAASGAIRSGLASMAIVRPSSRNMLRWLRDQHQLAARARRESLSRGKRICCCFRARPQAATAISLLRLANATREERIARKWRSRYALTNLAQARTGPGLPLVTRSATVRPAPCALRGESRAGSAVTGWRSRERLAAPSRGGPAMSRSAARARTGHDRTSLYSEITRQDHRRAWKPAHCVLVGPTLVGIGAGQGADRQMPKNAATQRPLLRRQSCLILWGAVIGSRVRRARAG